MFYTRGGQAGQHVKHRFSPSARTGPVWLFFTHSQAGLYYTPSLATCFLPDAVHRVTFCLPHARNCRAGRQPCFFFFNHRVFTLRTAARWMQLIASSRRDQILLLQRQPRFYWWQKVSPDALPPPPHPLHSFRRAMNRRFIRECKKPERSQPPGADLPGR